MIKNRVIIVVANSSVLLFFLNVLFAQIEVFLKDNVREVPLFGVANSSMRYSNFNSNIEYDFGEIDFEKSVECINPHILSFPAANPCYFDWTTGWSYTGEQIVDYINNRPDIYYDIDEYLFDENELGVDNDYGVDHGHIEGIQTNGEYFFQICNQFIIML